MFFALRFFPRQGLDHAEKAGFRGQELACFGIRLKEKVIFAVFRLPKLISLLMPSFVTRSVI
jgi:hypothetical protein